MYIQVKKMDGTRGVTTFYLSRLCTVADLKLKIQDSWHVEPYNQKLYHRGKHMEDAYKLFDYNVKLNDVIQVLEIVRTTPDGEELPRSAADEQPAASEESPTVANTVSTLVEFPNSKCYKVGDLVDYKQLYQVQGAWCEGRIHKILKPAGSVDDEGVVYVVSVYEDTDLGQVEVLPADIRPRSLRNLKWAEMEVGKVVMVNYNLDNEDERGFWYDLEITSLSKEGRGAGVMLGTLFVGGDRVPIEGVSVRFHFGVLEIRKPEPIELRDLEVGPLPKTTFSTRRSAPLCKHCNDKPRHKCKQCSCCVCGGKDQPKLQILCDECDSAYHVGCLTPPLDAIPDGEWYCPECKNDENEIVKTGDRLKESKRKAKLPSSNPACKRDWGHGMATLGRSKVCTIVPADHFGSIPGVEVGTTWKFRLQVSEAGVHRPPVSGIHGREQDGAYSIVLSGGYEDDVDNGDEFMYTGSGGRDLSGNKRTAEQSCDQELTRFNRAIAVNCDAPINDKTGATAKDWKSGKPIRVVRNYKLKKHSEYAPDDGNRYDGIYKVVEYFPTKGKSGFVVWRFALRRDDPIPAPWTPAGKKRVKSLGLEILYPDGYLAAQAAHEAEVLETSLVKGKGKVAKGKKTAEAAAGAESACKRPLAESTSHSPNSPKKTTTKRQKLYAYKLDAEISRLMAADKNVKLWEECKAALPNGKSKFMDTVMDMFMCICCQELVHEPITVTCMHNVCKACLKNSFAAGVYSCPSCRLELGAKYKMKVNAQLAEILLKLFPGYEAGR